MGQWVTSYHSRVSVLLQSTEYAPVPHDGSGQHGVDAHSHLRVLHQRVPQQVAQLLGVGAGRRRRSGVDDVVAQLPHRGAAEGQSQAHQLVQDAAKTPNVCTHT